MNIDKWDRIMKKGGLKNLPGLRMCNFQKYNCLIWNHNVAFTCSLFNCDNLWKAFFLWRKRGREREREREGGKNGEREQVHCSGLQEKSVKILVHLRVCGWFTYCTVYSMPYPSRWAFSNFQLFVRHATLPARDTSHGVWRKSDQLTTNLSLEW